MRVRGGQFGTRTRRPSPVGSVSAGPAGVGCRRVEGGCVERGMAK